MPNNNLPPVPKARKIGHNKENQKNLIAPIKEEEEDGQRTMIFSPKKNVDEQIKALPWYYPNVNREDCEKILEKQGKVGDYLLRESETKVIIRVGTSSSSTYCLEPTSGVGKEVAGVRCP